MNTSTNGNQYKNATRDPKINTYDTQDEKIDLCRSDNGWIDHYNNLPTKGRYYDFGPEYLPVMIDYLQLYVYLKALMAKRHEPECRNVKDSVFTLLEQRWAPAMFGKELKNAYWHAFTGEQHIQDFVKKVYAPFFERQQAKIGKTELVVRNVPFKSTAQDMVQTLDDFLDTTGVVIGYEAYWSKSIPEKWVHSGTFQIFVEQEHAQPLIDGANNDLISMTAMSRGAVPDTRNLAIKAKTVPVTSATSNKSNSQWT